MTNNIDDVRSENEAWFNWWRRRVAVAEELHGAGNFPDASLLIYAGLEALSQWWAALEGRSFPAAKRRFGEFLSAVGSNPDVFDRVSLPSLWRRAETDTRLTSSESSLLANHERKPPSRTDPIRSLSEDDPLKSTILDPGSPLAAFAATRLTDRNGNRSGQLGADWILDSRIGELLYERFRCPWVHEARPGDGTSAFRQDEPGYFSNRFTSPGSLDFPLPFMIAVYQAAISAMKSNAQTRGVRPARMDEDLGWR